MWHLSPKALAIHEGLLYWWWFPLTHRNSALSPLPSFFLYPHLSADARSLIRYCRPQRSSPSPRLRVCVWGPVLCHTAAQHPQCGGA